MAKGEKTKELWKNPEYRKHMSEVHKGNPSGKKGKKVSSETRKKLSLAQIGRIPWNKGLKGVQVHSNETREKMSKSHTGTKKPWALRGEAHYLYIKDRSKLAKRQERNDMAYKEWRMNVYKRDNFKCKIENEDCSGRIIAHHILGWSQYIELRYQINNGITLCQAHHPLKRAEEKQLVPTFQELLVNNV